MASPACEWLNKANYTDVVVVGNGPSAITLSYLLHGYRPYYNGNGHSNTMLTARLMDSKASVVDQDLEYLSEGLEGRSPNPVALLWDSLTHPDADLGAEHPSLLSWELEKSNAMSHIVLGKFKPGGSWQRIEGTMQTLSQNGWMELPDQPFRQWMAQRHRTLDFSSNRATTGDVRDYYEEYVRTQGLQEHFRDHHVVTSVQKVFHTANGADCDSGEVEPCCQNIRQNHRFLWEVRGFRIVPHLASQPHTRSPSPRSVAGLSPRLGSSASDERSDGEGEDSPSSDSDADRENGNDVVVSGGDSSGDSSGSGADVGGDDDSSSGDDDDAGVESLTELAEEWSLSGEREEFCYTTPHVVLATGTYDVPNRLGVSGEDLPTALHSLSALEQRLAEHNLGLDSDPICVVGAGLSAADAILMALESGIPVIHVFRCGARDPSLIFRRLPQSIYPEYHRVAQLMRGEATHELYQPYPGHRVAEIGQQMVLLQPVTPSSSYISKLSPARCPSPPGSESSIVSVDVSLTVIMIGSRPDLSFLQGGGRNLGVVPKWPIESKHNPVDVDSFTYESIHEQGLFALGPLIGDNFVRFGIGGALGIMNHLSSKKRNP